MANQKTAIVTGGSGGIGSAIVRALGRAEYLPVIVFNTNDEQSKLLEKEIKNSSAIKCDISSEDEVKGMVQKVLNKYGRIDLLVNNASPRIKYSRFAQKDIGEIKKHIMVSYFGAVNCSKIVLPQMVRQKEGSIINIISQYVFFNPPSGISDYICAKYALLGLTKCLAVEYAGKNIRVNAISPGMVETGFIGHLPPKAIELVKESTPLKRLTAVNDVANAVIFLASESASNITGVNLPLCGGNVMP